MVALASSIFEKEKIEYVRKVALIAAFFGISLAIGPSFTVLDWRGINFSPYRRFWRDDDFYFYWTSFEAYERNGRIALFKSTCSSINGNNHDLFF